MNDNQQATEQEYEGKNRRGKRRPEDAGVSNVPQDAEGPSSDHDSKDDPQPEGAAPVVTAGIFQSAPFSPELSRLILQLEDCLGMPVCLLIQSGDTAFSSLAPGMAGLFIVHKSQFEEGRKVALLLDSPGGDATAAYGIAEFLRRRCGGFTVVVPRYAKSAATLLSLGAESIILGEDGELGPLDAQIMDPDRESRDSALNDVLSLERLNAFALQATHELMLMLLQVAGKRIDVLLPMALKYVSDMMRPLLEDIDAVKFTQRSRDLKIAEEYASRLLRRSCGVDRAREIARSLVWDYPEHGFPIYLEEAESLGLRVHYPNESTSTVLDDIARVLFMTPIAAFGCIQTEAQDASQS